MSQWNQLSDLRAALIDGLRNVERAIIAVNTPEGKKAPEVKPEPRPLTAAQRAEKRRDLAQHNDLVHRLQPWRS